MTQIRTINHCLEAARKQQHFLGVVTQFPHFCHSRSIFKKKKKGAVLQILTHKNSLAFPNPLKNWVFFLPSFSGSFRRLSKLEPSFLHAAGFAAARHEKLCPGTKHTHPGNTIPCTGKTHQLRFFAFHTVQQTVNLKTGPISHLKNKDNERFPSKSSSLGFWFFFCLG